jgi:hypothetical protein
MVRVFSLAKSTSVSDSDASLFVDLAQLPVVARHLLDACDRLCATARPLRLPLFAPATDTVTLDLTKHCNQIRRSLGVLGEAAGDEILRIAEQILGGSYTMATIAARTQTAIIGLAVPAIEPAIAISPAAMRPHPGTPALAPTALCTDDEVLSFATLLCSGRPTMPDYRPADTGGLAEAQAAIGRAVEILATAISNPDRPAALLRRFAVWVGDYADALAQQDRTVEGWLHAYARARNELGSIAREYVSTLAAALAGESRKLDPSPAWAGYRQYVSLIFEDVSCPPFPRLASSAHLSTC